jgi:hypothetical protein
VCRNPFSGTQKSCEAHHSNNQAPPVGNELFAFSEGNTGVLEQGGAKSGALSGDSHIGGALAEWLDACPVALDDETAAAILAMVNVAGGSAAGGCR